jgi:histidinol-phosphate aminotransferase
MESLTRRSLLKTSGLALAAGIFTNGAEALPDARGHEDLVHLNLNENAFGASANVAPAIQRELSRLSRYGDNKAAQDLTEQIAAYERIDADQVVLGEILGALGLYLGSEGGPGGEFIYSTPGYLALIDAASHVGGVGVPVPLNERYENDLVALQSKVSAKTRAIYLINPHNPTGTVSDSHAFKAFLGEASKQAPVIVDEAYLEFTQDFEARSAVSLVRDGANVLVFRTFDKIHGLAGLPIGYTLVPKKLGATLRGQGLGDAESLGRLNMAAASAALADKQHVETVRATVASERKKWLALLEQLHLPHTNSGANFIFFDAGRPHDDVAKPMLDRGIQIARAFPPYNNWVRITIGTAAENDKARRALQQVLKPGTV